MPSPTRGSSWPDARVGLVGFGHVGRAIAHLCGAGLVDAVLAHTRSPWATGERLAQRVPLHELLAQSDFVVLACPLTDETRGLIGAPELALMQRGACLVNVARGPVVEEPALIEALQSRRLAGAALDVFDAIRCRDDHPYWQMEQVLITPHVAGHHRGQHAAMGHGAALAVEHLLRGEVPPNCINPQAVPAFVRRLESRRG